MKCLLLPECHGPVCYKAVCLASDFVILIKHIQFWEVACLDSVRPLEATIAWGAIKKLLPLDCAIVFAHGLIKLHSDPEALWQTLTPPHISAGYQSSFPCSLLAAPISCSDCEQVNNTPDGAPPAAGINLATLPHLQVLCGCCLQVVISNLQAKWVISCTAAALPWCRACSLESGAHNWQ